MADRRIRIAGAIAGVVLVLGLLSPVLLATAEPIAFDPATYVPASACDGMAYAAQAIADLALDAQPGDVASAVVAFDTAFSTLYIGRPMRTLSDALALLQSGGEGRRFEPGSPYLGETGFRSAFFDSGPTSAGREPIEVDQTHHVAAYLSAGINGLGLVARLHAATDNDGDARLGAAAFRLGASLTVDPAGLATIGDALRDALCEPTSGIQASLSGAQPDSRLVWSLVVWSCRRTRLRGPARSRRHIPGPFIAGRACRQPHPITGEVSHAPSHGLLAPCAHRPRHLAGRAGHRVGRWPHHRRPTSL
jgi:hypothetical protein